MKSNRQIIQQEALKYAKSQPKQAFDIQDTFEAGTEAHRKLVVEELEKVYSQAKSLEDAYFRIVELYGKLKSYK